jgi:hypothetical protein
MKTYYLSKGKFNGEYHLDCGQNFGNNRVNLKLRNIPEVIVFLKKELDFKRNTEFYFVYQGELNKRTKDSLESFFIGSKIHLKTKLFTTLED